MTYRPEIGGLLRALKKVGLLSESAEAVPSDAGVLPIQWFAERGLFDERNALEQLSRQFGITLTTLDSTHYEQITALLSHPSLRGVSLSEWRLWGALPWMIGPTGCTFLFANPFDLDLQRKLEFRCGSKVTPFLVSQRGIEQYLQKRQRLGVDSTMSLIIGSQSVENAPVPQAHGAIEETLQHEDAAAPVIVRIVDKILSDAIERGASDIHLVPEKEQLHAKIRLDGTLRPLSTVPSSLTPSVLSRFKLLSSMDIAEKRKPQDGRLRVKHNGATVDIRVSTVPSVYGETIVARILKGESARVSLDSIQMPHGVRTQYERLLKGSSKVLLVSGPTGSGKTSTLYAGLGALADGTRNIITIEDPVEYRIEGITQIQVNSKIGMGFVEGLRSVLRQDPDVVLVGEIRDLETAQTAMNAAQTGHLVLSTIHTNSAPGGIIRLLDLGVQDYVIASSVSAIIAQRLVRRLCPHCAVEASKEERARISDAITDTHHVRSAQGCEECQNTGYLGRIGVFSVLEITPLVSLAIRERRSEHEIESIARAEGFRTLWDNAWPLVEQGITSAEELERVLGAVSNVVAPSSDRLNVHIPSMPSEGISRRRLLLVEDDETTRAVLRMLFEDQMFDVEEATNGVEALERVYTAPPEIIVCDLMMPRMSGLDMVKRLRADARTSGIPVLMLTAAATEENELRLIDSGADDFVSKTTDSKILLARVNRLLSAQHR